MKRREYYETSTIYTYAFPWQNLVMSSNYPAGVTNQTIDDYFGPDEPEMDEEVITPRDILSRLIQEATGEGRRILQGALEYLWREHRLDSNAEATVALDRFLAGDRAASLRLK